jgi:putative hydrolase of the HAD superfamily
MPYLIWDFDGTLGYREGGWSGAMLDVLKENGLANGITAADIRRHILTGFRWHDPSRDHAPGVPADAWWEELTPLFAAAFAAAGRLSENRATALARKVREQYLRPEAWRLYNDSQQALEVLAAAGYIHILHSNHVPELPGLLSHLKIARYFQHIINSADTGFEKPHPQGYARVLSLLPAAADVTMIGDNPKADYAGARAAGMKAILVRRPTPGLTPYFGTLAELASALVPAAGRSAPAG